MLKNLKNIFVLEDYSSSKHVDPKTFRNIILQSSFLPIILSALLSTLFVIQIYNILEQNAKVRYSDETLILATKSLRLIIDSETGFRGFLLSGKDIYLEPWENAQKQFTPTFAKLTALSQENKDQLAALDEISVGYQAWLSQASEMIAKKRQLPLGTIPASHYNQIPQRKILMDNIREKFDHLILIEQQSRAKSWQEAESATKRTIFFILALGLGVGILISVVSIRNLKNLSNNYTTTLDALKDATDHLEEVVKTRTRELSEANKELEAFSYSVSHDLRAPLRGIDGFSQILIEDYSSRLDEESLRYLNFIRQGVQKMGILIDDLLNLSRLTRAEFRREELDLSTLVAETFHDLQALEPNRKVEFANIESTKIIGDSGLLRVAIGNLLSNAWKYTKNNIDPKIEFGQMKKDGKTVYFVKDNGVGFDMQFYNKLFQAFQRLHPKDQFNGTGIGLATVARVIRRHNGQIWADAKVGEGATFYFTLAL
jgi:signal transduction histidine kinase